jgi:hypothetical protein
MKLYDKLSVENIIKLGELKDKIPATYECMILSLDKKSWINLTIGEAHDLIIHLTNETLSIDAVDKLFNGLQHLN